MPLYRCYFISSAFCSFNESLPGTKCSKPTTTGSSISPCNFLSYFFSDISPYVSNTALFICTSSFCFIISLFGTALYCTDGVCPAVPMIRIKIYMIDLVTSFHLLPSLVPVLLIKESSWAFDRICSLLLISLTISALEKFSISSCVFFVCRLLQSVDSLLIYLQDNFACIFLVTSCFYSIVMNNRIFPGSFWPRSSDQIYIFLPLEL